MHKVTDYKVLQADTLFYLETEMKAYLKQGWNLFGSLVVKRTTLGSVFYQTIVKYGTNTGEGTEEA